MAAGETHEAIEAVFRIEQARLIAGLARITRDVSMAEDLAQEALLAALGQWPESGIPDRPGAWLMAVGKRRAMDHFRHHRMTSEKHESIAAESAAAADPTAAIEEALDDDLGDELLGLIFAACHPVLSPEARAALTLRLVGGLTTEEIARAFLSKEATIAARITRARKAIADAGLRFEVPRGAGLQQRLAAVLAVIYLIFNEGYAATKGEDLTRPALCTEAQRLGRILAGLMPEEPEVQGLLALMEIQASRFAARTDPDGGFVPLTEQDRAKWDRLLIRRGLAALEKAESLGGADGPYALQAALAACHARAATAEETDWPRIAALYDRLLEKTRSPVVALNRAIAHSMAFGPETGLVLLVEIENAPALAGFAPFFAAKADCLFRARRFGEAREAYLRAASLNRNARERDFLIARAGECQ